MQIDEQEKKNQTIVLYLYTCRFQHTFFSLVRMHEHKLEHSFLLEFFSCVPYIFIAICMLSTRLVFHFCSFYSTHLFKRMNSNTRLWRNVVSVRNMDSLRLLNLTSYLILPKHLFKLEFVITWSAFNLKFLLQIHLIQNVYYTCVECYRWQIYIDFITYTIQINAS